jgi:hypothetical protein
MATHSFLAMLDYITAQPPVSPIDFIWLILRLELRFIFGNERANFIGHVL